MLNEKKEFEQYTYPLDTEGGAVRLKHKTLCKDLSGTARAMTVIARKLYFDDDGPDKIDRVKDNLKAWCGDVKIMSRAHISPEIKEGWLPDYITGVLGEKKALEFEDYLMTEPNIEEFPKYQEICGAFREIRENFTIEAFREKGSRNRIMDTANKLDALCGEFDGTKMGKSKSVSAYAPVYNIMKILGLLGERYGASYYNKKMFNEKLEKPERNDFKKIMYEKIIADAIARGPLARYYLVCERDDLSNIVYVSARKETFPFQKRKRKNVEIPWTAATEKKADMIMKFIAAILLEQKARDAGELYKGAVPVNKTDVVNWLAANSGTDTLNQYFIEKRELFGSEEIDNVAVMGVDAQWMAFCGWNVILEKELDQYLSAHPGAVFFSDPGAGAFLRKNVRY